MADVELDDRTMEEFHRFYAFVREVIIPYEPESFVAHSAFHRQLMYTACKTLSATAAPRGFLKSQIFAKYRALHRLVDPTPGSYPGDHVDILLISETSKLIKDHLGWLKHHLMTNPEIEHRYGALADVAHLTWNEDEIQLTNGNRLQGRGYGSQLRGLHPTDIIIDDLESRHNVGSEQALEQMKDDFWRIIWPMRQPETRLAIIGTIVVRGSLLDTLVKTEEFHGRTWQALDASGQSIWPERWSTLALEKQRRIMGAHKFNAEMQNFPLGLGDLIIYPEWIRRHTPVDMAAMKPVRRYMACDPAFTEERWGDYSAIVVMDEMGDGRLFERLAWRKKVASPELIKTLINFYYHFRSENIELKFVIEEVAAQKMLRQNITEKDPTIQVESIKPDGDKTRRLVDVSRYFEMGIVSLATETLVEEVVAFPMGDKDRVDALVYCLKVYERTHPVISDGSHKDVDTLRHLDDTSLVAYLDRGIEGVPNHDIPNDYVNRYLDAMVISESLEDLWE